MDIIATLIPATISLFLFLRHDAFVRENASCARAYLEIYTESLLEIIAISHGAEYTVKASGAIIFLQIFWKGLSWLGRDCPERFWYWRVKEIEREEEKSRTKGILIKIPRGPCLRLIKTSDALRRSIGRLILLRLAGRYTRSKVSSRKEAKRRRRSPLRRITKNCGPSSGRNSLYQRCSVSDGAASHEKVIIGKYLARVIRMRPCE